VRIRNYAILPGLEAYVYSQAASASLNWGASGKGKFYPRGGHFSGNA